VSLACVKADRARALGQVSTGAIPSAISRWLQLRRLISRMFWSGPRDILYRQWLALPVLVSEKG
jgi:hypothetical protein